MFVTGDYFCTSKVQLPNKKLLWRKIIEGLNAKIHKNIHLPSIIYCTYSLIHAEDGMKEHTGQSLKNMVEGSVTLLL